MSKRGISLLLICVIIINSFLVISIQAEEKPRIAVYELTAKGLSENMVSTLSDVLRDTIFQTGVYEMLTKEDMKRILETMGEKQQITPDCDSDACIAEIADALGVKKIVTGSVGIVGKTYLISLRLVDAQEVRTINSVSVSCACEEDALIEKVKQGGLSLLGIKVKTKEHNLIGGVKQKGLTTLGVVSPTAPAGRAGIVGFFNSCCLDPRMGIEMNEGQKVRPMEYMQYLLYAPSIGILGLIPRIILATEANNKNGFAGCLTACCIGPRVGMELHERKIRVTEWFRLIPIVGIIPAITHGFEAFNGTTMQEIEREENLRKN